jgi:hypothetical protein
VLRCSARPPQGKKIKCPACGHAFLPELDDDEATGIREKPSPLAKRSSRKIDDGDPDEKPRSKGSRDDDDDDGLPDRKRRRDEDDDEDDRPIKKKRKKKSGSVMIMIGLGVFGLGGALLSCVLCGVGAFLWPGFLLPRADLEAFVPPDANVVMSGNPKLMRTKSANLEKLMRQQAAFAQRANGQAQLEDVSLNSERMLPFCYTNGFENKLVTIFQSTWSDIAKIKRNPNLGPAQTIGGHANIHKAIDQGKRNGLPAFIAFPGKNVVLTTEHDEKALLAALDRGKKPKEPNPALELSRRVDKSPFWMAVSLDANARGQLRRDLAQGAVMVPALANTAAAVDGIKGGTVAFDITSKEDVQIDAVVLCQNADGAGKIKAGAEAGLNLVKVGLQFAPQGLGQPRIPPTLIADLNSIVFSTKDASATASMKLSSQTLQDLVILGAAQLNFGR